MSSILAAESWTLLEARKVSISAEIGQRLACYEGHPTSSSSLVSRLFFAQQLSATADLQQLQAQVSYLLLHSSFFLLPPSSFFLLSFSCRQSYPLMYRDRFNGVSEPYRKVNILEKSTIRHMAYRIRIDAVSVPYRIGAVSDTSIPQKSGVSVQHSLLPC
ncbi:hypothetical protein L3X38_010759 [Prunus dulcis]|uniref:Uncharacterized protein n=1 Tax=Prunus dulcis TaxID=3755 RepID=A0AAD4WGV7_PRUDU|nr:hypothetical protein L3X38_010759 [Prunus dulcis]